jgi:hypothetical protein
VILARGGGEGSMTGSGGLTEEVGNSAPEGLFDAVQSYTGSVVR